MKNNQIFPFTIKTNSSLPPAGTLSLNLNTQGNATITVGSAIRNSFGDILGCSVSFWIKTDGSTNTTPGYTVIFGVDANFYIWTGFGGLYFWHTNQSLQSNVNIGDNLWHHVVCTVNSYNYAARQAKFKIFVDGVIQGTSPVVTVAPAYVTTSEYNIGGQSGNFLGCNITDLILWSKSLSPQDVTQLYNLGIPTDPNGTTITNAEEWWKLGDGDSLGVGGLNQAFGSNVGSTFTGASFVSDYPS